MGGSRNQPWHKQRTKECGSHKLWFSWYTRHQTLQTQWPAFKIKSFTNWQSNLLTKKWSEINIDRSSYIQLHSRMPHIFWSYWPNTIYCYKYVFKHGNFWFISSEVASVSYKLVQGAWKEKGNSCNYSEDKKWPSEVSVVKINLLRPMIFDLDLKENAGNDNFAF